MSWLLPIIICMLVGIVLLAVEVFMPGFGVPGISGLTLLVIGVVITWVNYGALVGLGMTVAVLALLGITVSISLKSAKNGRLAKSLVLQDEVDIEKADERDMQMFVGEVGTTLTPLRPVGSAEFACGKLSVSSDGEFIEKGTGVRIMRIVGTTILVERVNNIGGREKNAI